MPELYIINEYAIDGIRRPTILINIDIRVTLFKVSFLVDHFDFNDVSIKALNVIRR